MLPARVIRLSSLYKDYEDKQVALSRSTVAAARQVLADNAPPDTFVGRKTQEPFPKEEQQWMDRTILRQHLAEARRHVAQGQRHLVRQAKLIADLERDGHDTNEALKLLSTLRVTQNLHEQNVERILAELTQ